MHSLKEIIIPYSFYDKNWDIVTDTMENNLVIKNSFVNVKVNITIINYCSTDSSYTILNLFVDDSLFYTIDLGKSSEIKALYYAQDFLFENLKKYNFEVLEFIRGNWSGLTTGELNEHQDILILKKL